MFKKVFGNENDKEPIKYLIKQILNIVIILNSELIDKPYKDKNVIVDLIVKLKDDTKIVIELNTNVKNN